MQQKNLQLKELQKMNLQLKPQQIILIDATIEKFQWPNTDGRFNNPIYPKDIDYNQNNNSFWS